MYEVCKTFFLRLAIFCINMNMTYGNFEKNLKQRQITKNQLKYLLYYKSIYIF